MPVADHLRLGAWLNPAWDGELARRRIAQVGLDPRRRAVQSARTASPHSGQRNGLRFARDRM
jgi:hypothetical protein